jgi:hypothetical protein
LISEPALTGPKGSARWCLCNKNDIVDVITDVKVTIIEKHDYISAWMFLAFEISAFAILIS